MTFLVNTKNLPATYREGYNIKLNIAETPIQSMHKNNSIRIEKQKNLKIFSC